MKAALFVAGLLLCVGAPAHEAIAPFALQAFAGLALLAYSTRGARAC